MTEHPAAVFLQQSHTRAEELARAATPGPWASESDDPTDDEVYTVHDGEHGDLVGYTVAYVRGGMGVPAFDRRRANMQLIAALADPTTVLRRIAAERQLLADLLAEPHQVVEDCWYTCAAATEERDGGETCRDDMKGERCDCGRDERVERRVLLLAEGWGWTEGT